MIGARDPVPPPLPMIRFPLAPATAIALTAAAITSASQNPAGADVVAILRPFVRASDSELRRLERGSVLTKTLDSPDGKEVTSFGAIRVACTAEVFAERVRDIERFKASEYVLQIGRFHPQPTIDDLAGLTLDSSDREAMRTCRPGNCGLRLPAAAMERFKTSIPWGTAAETGAAAAAMRQFLVDEARTYLSKGSSALPDYADRSGTTPRAAAFRQLLRPSEFKAESQPELFRWLDEFPRLTMDGADSFLYWSHEKFGLKPTISMSHSVIVRRQGTVIFGSKQVFASHYFEASLGMALYVPVPGASYGYVTYLNRSRVDTLRGLLAPIARLVAARRARDGLERMLVGVKGKLEKH
jgi:hypothetical protein